VSVTALVLAAGAASRFGRPKQLEQVGGVPLVLRALAAGSPADERLVLLGSSALLIRPTVVRAAPTAQVAVVEDWRKGIGHVLATGIRLLPARTEAVVVLLADQPFVTAEAVRNLIQVWRNTGDAWVCAGYGDRRGHPHLFAASWFPSLASLDGDAGAHAVTGDAAPSVVPVDGDDADIDDESDLLRLTAGSPRVSGGRLFTDRQPPATHPKRGLPSVIGAGPGGIGAGQPGSFAANDVGAASD
jgi:molybdenum cofactor cytidylyltransferase